MVLPALLLSVLAAGPAAAPVSKKDQYLADKQARPPRRAGCCPVGIHLSEEPCTIDPACRPALRAGDRGEPVVYARNLHTDEVMPWSGPVVLGGEVGADAGVRVVDDGRRVLAVERLGERAELAAAEVVAVLGGARVLRGVEGVQAVLVIGALDPRGRVAAAAQVAAALLRELGAGLGVDRGQHGGGDGNVGGHHR